MIRLQLKNFCILQKMCVWTVRSVLGAKLICEALLFTLYGMLDSKEI